MKIFVFINLTILALCLADPSGSSSSDTSSSNSSGSSSDEEPPPPKKRARTMRLVDEESVLSDSQHEPQQDTRTDAIHSSSYQRFTKEALQDACKLRNIQTSGSRPTLILRLEAFDREQTILNSNRQRQQEENLHRETPTAFATRRRSRRNRRKSRRTRRHRRRRENNNNNNPAQLRRHFVRSAEAPPYTFEANLHPPPFSNRQNIAIPGIPQQQLDKIQKGEFVNFNLLLPQPASASNSTQSFTLSVSEDDPGSLSISGTGDSNHRLSKGKVKVSNPQWWFLAWSLFFGAMMVFHEHLAPLLIRYQERICRFFTTYPFQCVADYDVQFRRKLAVNPTETFWDRIDLDIFSSTLRPQVGSFSSSQAGSFPDVTCYKCKKKGHYATRCPNPLSSQDQTTSTFTQSRPPRPPISGANAQNPFQGSAHDASTEACPYFNSSFCRRGATCRYAHKCSYCGRPGHLAHSCRASRPSG
uniref:Cleavage and polyadenylation specificity factor subunit 4 n=1 Tax=Clytia hemisphaerica TaxID=252671 RepID=A0A7M5X3I7_9CNID